MSERRFPILDSTGLRSIPWAMLVPNARQALDNHDQTLERLAERGGLAAYEALAVLDGRKWRKMDDAVSSAELRKRVEAWEQDVQRAEIASLRAQHATLRSLTEALIASLPKCDNHPDRPATKAVKRGGGRWCDECGDPKTWRGPYAAHDYPRAAPLRALVAELAKGES